MRNRQVWLIKRSSSQTGLKRPVFLPVKSAIPHYKPNPQKSGKTYIKPLHSGRSEKTGSKQDMLILNSDCHSGHFSVQGKFAGQKKRSHRRMSKKGSNFNAWWLVPGVSGHANRPEWEDPVLSGYFLPLEDRFPIAPDLNNPVIEDLEILPHPPGREYPDLPGYDSGFRNPSNLLNIFAEQR